MVFSSITGVLISQVFPTNSIMAGLGSQIAVSQVSAAKTFDTSTYLKFLQPRMLVLLSNPNLALESLQFLVVDIIPSVKDYR
jgi:hypothetical protein